MEEAYNIDVTQFASSSEKEKATAWSNFALKHLKEMRVLKDAGLLGKENKDWRNVTEHVLVTSALAGFLARQLRDKGCDIDPQIIESAAVLHDASKRLDVEKKVRYGTEKKEGALIDLLKKFGYSKEFIENCSYTARVPGIFLEDEKQDEAIRGKNLEYLVVAYSDARIRNVNVVSLEEARDKNKQKAPKDSDFYDKWYIFYKKVESRILREIGDIKPEDINNERVLESLSKN